MRIVLHDMHACSTDRCCTLLSSRSSARHACSTGRSMLHPPLPPLHDMCDTCASCCTTCMLARPTDAAPSSPLAPLHDMHARPDDRCCILLSLLCTTCVTHAHRAARHACLLDRPMLHPPLLSLLCTTCMLDRTIDAASSSPSSARHV